MTGRTIRPRPLSNTERIPVIFLSRGKDGEDDDAPPLDPALEQFLRTCEEERQQQQGGLLSGLEYSRACKKRRLNKAPPTSNTTATATTGAASQPIAVPTCRDIPDYDANLRALAAASTRRAVEGVPGGPASSSLLSDTSPSLGGLYTARGTPLPPHTALPHPHAHLASDSDPPTGLSSLAALDAPPDPADAYIIYQEDVLARDQRRDPPLLQYDMDEEDEAALAAVNAATAAAGAPKAGGSSSRPPPATRGAAAAAAAAARSLLDADSFEALMAALERAHFTALQQRKELWETEVKAGRVPKLPRTDKVLPWEAAVGVIQRHQPPLPPLPRPLYLHWLKRRRQENGPLLGYLWYEQPWKAISFRDRSPGREGQQGDMPFMATETKNTARGGWNRLRIDKSDVYSRLAEVREELELLRTTADQVRKRERLKKQLLKLYRAEVLAKLGLTHHSKHSHAAAAAPHGAAAAASGACAADPAAGTAMVAGTAGAAPNMAGGAGTAGAGTSTERSRKRRRVAGGGEGAIAQLQPRPADAQPQEPVIHRQRVGKKAAAAVVPLQQPQQPLPAQAPSQQQPTLRGPVVATTGKARAADASTAPACVPAAAAATGAAGPRPRGTTGRVALLEGADAPSTAPGGMPQGPRPPTELPAKRDRVAGRNRPNAVSVPVKQGGQAPPQAAAAAAPTGGGAPRRVGRAAGGAGSAASPAAGATSKRGEEDEAAGPSGRRGVARKAATPSSSSSSASDDDDDDDESGSGDGSDDEDSGRAAGSSGDANSSQVAGVEEEEERGQRDSDEEGSGDSGSSAAQVDSEGDTSGSSDDSDSEEEDQEEEESEEGDSDSNGRDEEERATGVLGDCRKGRPVGTYALRTRLGALGSLAGTGRRGEQDRMLRTEGGPLKAPTRTQKAGAQPKTRQLLQPAQQQDDSLGARGRGATRRDPGPRTRARVATARVSTTPPSLRATSPAASSPTCSSSPTHSGAAHQAHTSSSPEYSRSLSRSPPPPSRQQPQTRRTHNGGSLAAQHPPLLRNRGAPSTTAAAVPAATAAPDRLAARQPHHQRPRPRQAGPATQHSRRKPHPHVRLAGQIAAAAAARARHRTGTAVSGSAAVRQASSGARKGNVSSPADNTRHGPGTSHKKTSSGWLKELTLLMGSPPEATAAATAAAAGSPTRGAAERRERAVTTTTRSAAAGAGEPAAAVGLGGQKRTVGGSGVAAGAKVKDSAGANPGTKVLTRKRKTLGIRNGIAT